MSSSKPSISCTEPPSANILSHTSFLFNFNLFNTLTSVGFLRIKVPFADCSVNTLAAQGSIPGETFPASLLLLTVGAIARR